MREHVWGTQLFCCSVWADRILWVVHEYKGSFQLQKSKATWAQMICSLYRMCWNVHCFIVVLYTLFKVCFYRNKARTCAWFWEFSFTLLFFPKVKLNSYVDMMRAKVIPAATKQIGKKIWKWLPICTWDSFHSKTRSVRSAVTEGRARQHLYSSSYTPDIWWGAYIFLPETQPSMAFCVKQQNFKFYSPTYQGFCFLLFLQMYDCWWGKHTQTWLRKSIFQPSRWICHLSAALPLA